jgi:hypothetical protein
MNMNKRGWLGLAVVASVVCGSCEAVEIEKPVVLDEALICVTASDFHGLVDGVGSVVAKVQPMFNGVMLKQMMGNAIGDPQLEGIPAGKGLAVVMLTESNYFAVAEIAASKLESYTNVLSSMGMQLQVEDELLVVAKDAASLKMGVDLAEEVEDRLLDNRSPSLRIAARPAAYFEMRQQDIDKMMFMLPMMMGSQLQQEGVSQEQTMMTARFLEGKVRVLISLAKQLGAYEVEVLPKGGDLYFTEVMDAVEGSNLERLFSAPTKIPYNDKLGAGLLDDGALELDIHLQNPDALMDFVEAEAKALSSVMSLNEGVISNYLAMCREWMDVFGGTISESILNGDGGKFGASYIVELKNEQKALELLKDVQRQWEKSGVDALYKEVGCPVTMEFAEAVRTYKEVPIHQLKVNIDTTAMAEDQKAALDLMMGEAFSMDLAFAKGVMVYTTESGKMDAILDQLVAAEPVQVAPLAARKQFPSDGFIYLDLNVERYMEFAGLLMKDDVPELAQMAALFKGVEPVVVAGYCDDGLVQMRSRIPGDLITRIAQVVLMAKMQQGAVQ